jgi:hypothetical protein
MDENLLELFEKFIEAKIAHELAKNDGLYFSAKNKARELKKIKKDILGLSNCIRHANQISKL